MSNGIPAPRPEVPAPGEVRREVSNVEQDEKAYEQLPESKETFLEKEESRAPVGAHGNAPGPSEGVMNHAPALTATEKDEVLIHVEKIMEEGLGALYASLPDDAKPVFRKKGEEVAHEIGVMVRSVKIQTAKILRLIREWLLTIPKANRFFLEQEAKIKTDKILEFVNARREDADRRP